MNRICPLPSNEAELLNTRSSRASTEDIELRNDPYDAADSPSPSLAAPSYYSRGPGVSTPARAPTRIDSRQQTHHRMRNQDEKLPFQNQNHQSNSYSYRSWMWEVLSIVVAVIALAATVITLILRRDRPLPKWPSAITINALIAVFTAIFKACLMMPTAECIGQLKWLWYRKPRPLGHMEKWDLASRGPWGSLLLIFIVKIQGLAVIGAILTIVAMAVDPFTQQIVQFYSCSTVIEGERGIIPFSNNYTDYTAGSGQWTEPDLTLDPQMQSAIYMGLLGPLVNTYAAVNFECKTGNCTFPSTDDGATFQSLALESQCTDIASDIAFSVTDAPSEEDETIYETTTSARLPQYNLSLTGGSKYDSSLGRLDFFTSGSKLADSSDRWPSSFLNKVAFLMSHSYSSHLAEPEYTYAFECEFYPVVQTYSANVKNGVLLEQVLNTQRMDIWPSDFEGAHALLLVDRTIREGRWHECTSSPKPSNEHILPVSISVDPFSQTEGSTIVPGWPPEELPNIADNITWWPQDCVYWLPYQTAGKLAEVISSILGSETLSRSIWIDRAKWNPWFLNIWNDGHPTLDAIQAIMDGLTQAVTARLRQGDGFSLNAGPANGTVWGVETCVHVNWGWIALPAGLLLLTIVFLALTIFKTRLEHAQVWKSSILAVLFSGFDQEARKADGPVASLEEMKAAADRATVRLEDSKDGFRLVSQT